MRADNFLDTNILVYAFVPDDLRTPVADGLLAAGGRISVQVLNELTNVVTRKYKLGWDKVSEISADVCSLCGTPAPVTLSTHQLALRIVKRYGFQFYDCLIVAAALESGCEILYTEDLQHGQQIEGLTITNPFLLAPTN